MSSSSRSPSQIPLSICRKADLKRLPCCQKCGRSFQECRPPTDNTFLMRNFPMMYLHSVEYVYDLGETGISPCAVSKIRSFPQSYCSSSMLLQGGPGQTPWQPSHHPHHPNCNPVARGPTPASFLNPRPAHFRLLDPKLMLLVLSREYGHNIQGLQRDYTPLFPTSKLYMLRCKVPSICMQGTQACPQLQTEEQPTRLKVYGLGNYLTGAS